MKSSDSQSRTVFGGYQSHNLRGDFNKTSDFSCRGNGGLEKNQKKIKINKKIKTD